MLRGGGHEVLLLSQTTSSSETVDSSGPLETTSEEVLESYKQPF